jgi:hypothetical protein
MNNLWLVGSAEVVLIGLHLGRCDEIQGNTTIVSTIDTTGHMWRTTKKMVLAIVLCAGVAWCAGDDAKHADAGAANSAAHAAQGSSVPHRQ